MREPSPDEVIIEDTELIEESPIFELYVTFLVFYFFAIDSVKLRISANVAAPKIK